jgi:tetratricopeptide (TPR) repeat protein
MEFFLIFLILIILYIFFHQKRAKNKILKVENIQRIYQDAIQYMIEKKYLKAKREFEKILSFGEKNANIFFQYGRTLYSLKEYDNSLVFYAKSLKLSNKDTILQIEIYQAIAKVWDKKEENNKSILSYNKSIELLNSLQTNS